MSVCLLWSKVKSKCHWYWPILFLTLTTYWIPWISTQYHHEDPTNVLWFNWHQQWSIGCWNKSLFTLFGQHELDLDSYYVSMTSPLTWWPHALPQHLRKHIIWYLHHQNRNSTCWDKLLFVLVWCLLPPFWKYALRIQKMQKPQLLIFRGINQFPKWLSNEYIPLGLSHNFIM